VTAAQLVLGALTVAVGASLQGLTGFGANLVAVPLLLLISPSFVPGPIVVAGTVLNVLSSIRASSDDVLSDVKWTITGQLPGAGAAAVVLVATPQKLLILIFAGSVLIAAIASASGWRPPVNRPILLGAGAASGFFGTIAGIGGPPVALLWQDAGGPALRASLARHFLAGALIAIPLLILAGRLGPEEAVLALALLPGTFLGFAASGPITRMVDGHAIRALVIALSAASAIVVAMRELL
jgi:uncharacterized membrane protein YfcA